MPQLSAPPDLIDTLRRGGAAGGESTYIVTARSSVLIVAAPESLCTSTMRVVQGVAAGSDLWCCCISESLRVAHRPRQWPVQTLAGAFSPKEHIQVVMKQSILTPLASMTVQPPYAPMR